MKNQSTFIDKSTLYMIEIPFNDFLYVWFLLMIFFMFGLFESIKNEGLR